MAVRERFKLSAPLSRDVRFPSECLKSLSHLTIKNFGGRNENRTRASFLGLVSFSKRMRRCQQSPPFHFNFGCGKGIRTLGPFITSVRFRNAYFSPLSHPTIKISHTVKRLLAISIVRECWVCISLHNTDIIVSRSDPELSASHPSDALFLSLCEIVFLR